MKIVGLLICRNESWVLGLSLRVALKWMDEIVILNHGSTDNTMDIIRKVQDENPCRVHCSSMVLEEHWNEMEHRQLTLEWGRKVGGTHFAIIDADEVLTSNLLTPGGFRRISSIRTWIERLEREQVLDIPMVPCWRSLFHYRNDDSVWSRAMLTLAFRDSPDLFWRKETDGYCHHARAPYGTDNKPLVMPVREHGGGGVMHLQFANWRRLKAKHAWYKMTEAIRWPDRMTMLTLDAKYNEALDERRINISKCPDEWWLGYKDIVGHVAHDGVPWQSQECKRLWDLHGPEAFKGLNLWDVIDD